MQRYMAVEPLIFEWSEFGPRAAVRALPAIIILLVIGLTVGHPAAGMIAAAGAVSVGFGSFQRINNSQAAPMLLGTIGMCVSTLVGTLAGQSALTLASMAGLWGFVYGLLMALGSGASWVGLQSVIALLVVSAYPVSVGRATGRAALILAGGLLQTLSVFVLLYIEKARPEELKPTLTDFPPSGFLPALRILKKNLALHSEALHYGLRLAVTLAITAGVVRSLSLPNGYWVPMTALIVLKPDFHQTLTRGVARIIGTFAGAGLATLIVASVRPGPVALAILVIGFAWLCYSFLRVNYATYAVCITVYIVFLLAFAGLPAMTAVKYRTINTALGGLCALAAYAFWPVSSRRAPGQNN